VDGKVGLFVESLGD
jgi:hypothetical protein